MERVDLQVLKIGGKLINDQKELEKFVSIVSQSQTKSILIHGGGRKATELSALLGIPTQMIDGRRITNKETLEVAIMVYAGLINKQIVSSFQSHGINAIGLSGADGNIIQAHRRPAGEIDYGFVGDIDAINANVLSNLLEIQLMPVCCAISHDGNSQLLNTNADTIAAQIAIAMSDTYNVSLKYCFEYPGVLYDTGTPNVVIGEIRKSELEELKNSGIVNSGMLPKLKNAFDALDGGVSHVSICGIENLISGSNATALKL
jgi:acetylglutamate kinase